MKKIISFALVLALASAMAVPVMAEGNTTGGDTTVTYTVDSSYTVTITPTVTLDPATNSTTQDFAIPKGSIIDADKDLAITITAATNYDTTNSKFRLKNNKGTDVYVDYTIKNGTAENSSAVALNEAFLTATPTVAFDSGATTTLTLKSGPIQQAGTYSDTLTYSVAMVTPKQA